MKILAVGGGSGGHVTPVAAVLKELQRLDKQVELRFWCDRAFTPQARQVMQAVDASMPISTIVSGKLRRYHGISVWRQLLDIPTLLRNIRDMFLVMVGVIQSVCKLLVWRPDVIFTKGGFVCLPVGIAAHWLRIPLVIHDSDTLPGLTNRILARWARVIATGAPLEYYSYPRHKSVYVGVPVSEAFHPFTPAERIAARQKIGVPTDKPLLVVTGGGLGARRINEAIVAVAPALLQKTSIIHISGASQYETLRTKAPEHADYKLFPFVDNVTMAQMLGAADVVVARAGATTLLELAALRACVVIIPNPLLTGGHQIKNAEAYSSAKAAVVVQESDIKQPLQLQKTIERLVGNSHERELLGERIHQFARPQAALQMADIIYKQGSHAGQGRG